MIETTSPEAEQAAIREELAAKRKRHTELLHGGLLNELGSYQTVTEGERLEREIAELEKLLGE
jgi:hypothetical protein